ncbi:hypothetical protein CEXT_738351 [Caerostris extrusa]|uniref:Uncharacterized protein n=1 Tax=Caerostris extrusa TaxID=172846 RepID=A0AAV4VPX1_CAEEX|nr:hypothetical protein CEXT_738351 [Caerostris extrusa]
MDNFITLDSLIAWLMLPLLLYTMEKLFPETKEFMPQAFRSDKGKIRAPCPERTRINPDFPSAQGTTKENKIRSRTRGEFSAAARARGLLRHKKRKKKEKRNAQLIRKARFLQLAKGLLVPLHRALSASLEAGEKKKKKEKKKKNVNNSSSHGMD